MLNKKNYNLKRAGTGFRNISEFMTFLLPYWKRKLAIIILTLSLVPLSLVLPFLTKLMIDKAYGNKDLGLFIRLATLGAAIFIIAAIIEGLDNYFESKLMLKVNFDLNSRVFTHLQKLSLGFFQGKSTGEHIYRINYDLEQVTHMVTQMLPQFILLGGRFLLTLGMVFYLNWKMALVCIIFSPLLYLQPYYFIKKRQEISKKQIELSESIFIRLEEAFSHIHLIKAFGREDFEIRDFLGRLRKRSELLLQDVGLSFFSALSGNGLRRLVLGVLSLYGGYQIIKGNMSLGSLTAIMIYSSQLIYLQGALSGEFEQLSLGSISCGRVSQILDTKPDIVDKEDAKVIDLSKADIEFENVTFGYQESTLVLKDLSFHIKHGSFIALVGFSGCGKTTLLSLILRLYDVKEGKILIGGCDIKDINSDSLKSQIGMALQEPFLWNDTIANNIRYGKEGATFVEIEHAAKAAQIHQFIASLPKGYDTNIGEMASKISQGQKQRLAIARALIKKPAVIILDEAMSSLDSQTEERIIENLKSEFRTSTLIVVSHRLSTAKNMDLVYFLEAPGKMEVASHQRLLDNSPAYKDLFSAQIEAEKSYKL